MLLGYPAWRASGALGLKCAAERVLAPRASAPHRVPAQTRRLLSRDTSRSPRTQSLVRAAICVAVQMHSCGLPVHAVTCVALVVERVV